MGLARNISQNDLIRLTVDGKTIDLRFFDIDVRRRRARFDITAEQDVSIEHIADTAVGRKSTCTD